LAAFVQTGARLLGAGFRAKSISELHTPRSGGEGPRGRNRM